VEVSEEDMKELRAGPSVTVGDVELMAVTAAAASGEAFGPGVSAFGTVEPIAIVFRAGGRTWAVDVEGREVSLDALVRDVAGLREALNPPSR
jgi:hypothetical protein